MPRSLVAADARSRRRQRRVRRAAQHLQRGGAPSAGGRFQRCAADSGPASNRAVIPAGTAIPAGGSWLLTNFAAGGYSGSVPGDQTYTTGISDQGGVRIANAGVAVDGVANQDASADQCREGTGVTFPGANADNGFERIGGSLDTDRNNLDFTGPKVSNPQISSSQPEGDPAPRVAGSDRADGALGADPAGSIAVTFSEPVTTGADPFSLACSDGSSFDLSASSAAQTTYALDPDGSLPLGESCTLTVHGGAVSDVDAQDPPDTMTADRTITFFVQGLALRIHDIQGAGHLSPYQGKAVDGVPGVVTGRRNNGFWMQDTGPDGDPATSEGLFVVTSTAPTVAVGAAVTVSGLVAESRPGGSGGFDNLTTTELERVTVTPAGAGASIAPTVVGAGGRVPPNQVIEDDASGSVETSGLFDSDQDGIDFYESLEGMKLQVNDAVEVQRHAQAAAVNGFVKQILASDKNACVVVLGDINDFEFSETTQILEGDELVSLLHGLPKPERYSYVFEGNSQVLDQILVSKPALGTVHGFDAVHVNAEFFDQASDHDPSVTRLDPGDAQ